MKSSTLSLVCSLAGLTSALYVPVTVERRDSRLPSFTLPSDVGIPFTSGQNLLAAASNQPAIQNDHDLLVSLISNCFIGHRTLIRVGAGSIKRRSLLVVKVSWFLVYVVARTTVRSDTVGNLEITVQVDTGSSDLWVFSERPISNFNLSEAQPVNISYGSGSGVYYFVSYYGVF